MQRREFLTGVAALAMPAPAPKVTSVFVVTEFAMSRCRGAFGDVEILAHPTREEMARLTGIPWDWNVPDTPMHFSPPDVWLAQVGEDYRAT